jgi:hypothetical protein
VAPPTDVATREEERLHDECVGSEPQPAAVYVDDGLIIHARQNRVLKCGEEDVAHEFRAELAPAAMTEQHAAAGRQGHWTH